MRKLKLLLMTLALIVGGIGSAWAQSWTGNAPAAGEFYLYNVGQQKFLTSGNWWGTHAALDTDGMAVTLAGDGSYTISTAVAFAGKYLGDNEYVDNGTAASWTFEKVGETDKYTMKTGTKYFVSNANGVPVNSETAPTTDAGYWQLVTRQQLIDNLNNATPASPIDASFYMTNPKVRRGWPKSIEGTDLNDNGSFNAGNEGLYAGGCTSYGQWHKTFDNYQALTGVKNGKYKVRVKGVIRIDDGENVHIPYLYANDQKGADFKTIVESDYSSLAGGNAAEKVTHLLVDDTYLLDWLEVTVTDGNLRVGVKSDANVGWATFAQFTIMFVDPCISSSAIELPANGAMAADTWYKYTVAVTGNYSISATTEANIIQTTSGDQLNSVATGSALVTGANVALTAGDVIYYKSNSANTLTIEANIKTYTVGDVTATSIADNTYLQSLTTATFTLGDAASNDGTATLALQGTPVASLKKGDSEVKTGALTLNAETHVVTAAFESVTLDPDATYTITLPANAVAWDKNTTNKNSEKVITFKTPAVFDGTYFLKVVGTYNGSATGTSAAVGKYLARGNNYGTHATIDTYGLPIKVTTDVNNNTSLSPDDTKRYYFHTGGWDAYADKTPIDDNSYFNITKLEDGKYTIGSTKQANKYWKYNDSDVAKDIISVYDDGTGTNSGPILLWAPETPADHATAMQALKDAQAATAATAASATATYASLAGKTTVATLEEGLASYVQGDFKAPSEINSVSEKYQGGQPGDGNTGEEVYSNTINITEAGLYKFSMQAFYRAGSNEVTQALHTAGADFSPVALFFGSAETQIKSLYDETGLTSFVDGDNVTYNGKKYANNKATALEMFKANLYHNDVYLYVSESGEYTYGVKYMGFANANAQWFIYSPESVTITSYAPAATADDYSDLATAISTAEGRTLGFEAGEYAPYNLAAPLAAAKAINPSATNSKLLVTSATTALNAVTANTEEVNAFYDAGFANTAAGSVNTTGVTGWTTADVNNLRQIVTAEKFYNDKALYMWPATVKYGETVGYTMPLKANTWYIFTYSYGGWSDNMTAPSISIQNASNEGFELTSTGSAPHYTEGVKAYTKVFKTGGAGNYIFSYKSPDGTNTVIGDFSLKRCATENLNMVITDAEWATFIAPFDVTIPDGVKAYTVEGINTDRETLDKTEVATGTIKANTPVLLNGPAGTYPVSGVNIADETSYKVGALVGVYEDYKPVSGGGNDNYVLQNQNPGNGLGFYITDTDASNVPTVSPNHAYLQVASGGSAKAFFFDDDDATIIESVDVLTSSEYDVIYNATGIQVEALQKGLNIVVKDGKSYKIYVK